MADESTANENEVSRERLAELLNEDLAREYHAIIGYVVYSQVWLDDLIETQHYTTSTRGTCRLTPS